MTQHGAGHVTCPECRAVLPDLERQWVGHEDGCSRGRGAIELSDGTVHPTKWIDPLPLDWPIDLPGRILRLLELASKHHMMTWGQAKECRRVMVEIRAAEKKRKRGCPHHGPDTGETTPCCLHERKAR